MALWIRVDTDVADNPKIGRFAAKLGLEIEQAVGHLVRVWGNMADQKSDGCIRGVSAATLESWANWRGKRGRFSEAFRKTFVVKGGIVKGWGERQGKLILKQLAHREYMRAYRVSHRGGSSKASSDPHRESHVRPLTVTKDKPSRSTQHSGQNYRNSGDTHPTAFGTAMEKFLRKTGRSAQATDAQSHETRLGTQQ